MRWGIFGWAVGGGAVALMIAVLSWGLLHPSKLAPSGILGQSAPALTIAALDGPEVGVSGFRGTPVVVNFWASWCVPCRQEAPVLNAAASNYLGRVQFLGVDIQDSDAAARSYQAQIQSPYPVGPASQGSYLRWGVTAPPETFFINRQGVVVSRILGPVDPKRFEARLQELAP